MRVKNSKGITLVALIITIVVLLILAVVSIGSIQENGLIEKANGAVSKWNDAQNDEGAIMNSYLDYLNQYGGGSEEVCSHSWNGSVCEICGLECDHPSEMREYFITYVEGDEKYCYVDGEDCLLCGMMIWDSPWWHSFDSTTGICSTCNYQCEHSSYDSYACSTCGYACVHSNVTTSYYAMDTSEHEWVETCVDCGHISSWTFIACSDDGTGKCKYCRQTLQ